jgi:TRAP-type C4-dicarboxylate transport system substrate-binding protein
MKYHLHFGRVLFAAIAILFSMLALPNADARKVRLRLTTLAPKDSSFHKSLLRMGQDWKTDTKGEVNLIVFAGGIQGGESAMVDRMRINQTQAALLTGVGLAEMDDGVSGLQKVPMLYRTLDELEYVMEKITPVMEARIRKKGFEVLAWLDTGWICMFSKSALETPEDMMRMKLYTWTGDRQQTDLLKKLGFRPIPIESTEILPSLQTGLIDAVPLPPFYALASQAYKSAPFMLDFNYAPMIGAIVVSGRVWERIPPEQQSVMREAAARATQQMRIDGRRENEESIRIMAEEWDLKVKKMDMSLRDQWEGISNDAHSFIRDNTVPADIWDEVVRHIEVYRSTQN